MTANNSRTIMQEQTPVMMYLADIQADSGFQLRVTENTDAIERYAGHYEEGGPEALPPVICLRTKEGCLLVDGFHRVKAAYKAGIAKIPVVIMEPNLKEGQTEEQFGLAYAMEFNLDHGTPYSTADRKNAARKLLEFFPCWTVREIAKRVGLSKSTIANLRREVYPECIPQKKEVQPEEIESGEIFDEGQKNEDRQAAESNQEQKTAVNNPDEYLEATCPICGGKTLYANETQLNAAGWQKTDKGWVCSDECCLEAMIQIEEELAAEHKAADAKSQLTAAAFDSLADSGELETAAEKNPNTEGNEEKVVQPWTETPKEVEIRQEIPESLLDRAGIGARLAEVLRQGLSWNTAKGILKLKLVEKDREARLLMTGDFVNGHLSLPKEVWE